MQLLKGVIVRLAQTKRVETNVLEITRTPGLFLGHAQIFSKSTASREARAADEGGLMQRSYI